MSETLSGTYIGTAGTRKKAAGIGLATGTLQGSTTLTFMASVTGGAGYSYTQYGITGHAFGGAGGIGVDVAAGDLTNLGGQIIGGAGGDGVIPINGSGDGGIGIRLDEATSHLLNYGRITGGAGGRGGRDFAQPDGAGGIGADLKAGGVVDNMGAITGGAGGSSYSLNHPQGGAGGDGLFFGSSGMLNSWGSVYGGAGGLGVGGYAAGAGGAGVEMKAGGVLNNNFGAISGGRGGLGSALLSDGGNGGTGILLDHGGNVVNGVNVHGGDGGASSAKGGNGGIGLNDNGTGFVTNYGIVTGGNGGASGEIPFGFGATGGTGVKLGRGAVLENVGTIRGGEGGNEGGEGGAGVILQTGTSPYNINDGLISGGAGEPTGISPPGYGGIGLEMLTRGSFRNFGTIEGGAGAVGKVHINISYGGGAYFAKGGTLENGNGGLITSFSNADALLFGGTGHSRLILDAGSTIRGTAQADGTHNVLELSGATNPAYGITAALSGLGTQYVGFDTLAADIGSYWTVSGSVASLTNAGTLAVAAGASLDVTGAIEKASTGAFVLTGMASMEIANLLGNTSQIGFLGGSAGNLLIIDDPAKFGLHVGKTSYSGPLLEGFQSGDSIDLKGIGAAVRTEYYSQTGVLQIQNQAGAALASLQFQTASLGPGIFQLAPDNTGGTLLTRS